MGAKTTADLVRQGHLTREEGTYLLGFCNNVSPAFFMNYICMHALGYHQIPWKIVLLFYALPVCYGILTRPFYHFPYDRNICTKKQAPMQRAYISDAGCLYYGQFRNHYPAWRIYYSVFCLQSDAAAYFCLICSAAAAGVHSGNQLWHTGSLQFLFRSIVRPSGSSLFLRFFWWIMYFCADKKCPLSCRNQDMVIYCWSSVSGSSVVSSVSPFTEAVSGASSWRLLMIVS